ncbi:hypothetical protein ACMV_P1_01450 (plasmid) [Acidiphilium multivorum AIU301]|uniref:Metallo-beta-lactamase domain-containing protein n=1 Tax=Acidiphilium multivorum (strain DSM 11245 / JCM 8867 / NBRC 100883 / AIU 301) TaxID=926570 RepID=F0J774_ACIMA|nr:MBL fold metallo-hydrolase [Acidiphilium multivorum]BAJ82941.1 hypothetical protein ACMV_P1_01450 [Acidiphilium multivorum AIU301]
MVVDPLFPIEPYLLAASTSATPIRLVIDTHLHADHRSAGRALAAAAGADYVIHEQCGSLQCLPSARRGSGCLHSEDHHGSIAAERFQSESS